MTRPQVTTGVLVLLSVITRHKGSPFAHSGWDPTPLLNQLTGYTIRKMHNSKGNMIIE